MGVARFASELNLNVVCARALVSLIAGRASARETKGSGDMGFLN